MERGTIYPSWRYHKTHPPVLCNDAAHDAELGDEWNDTNVFPAEAEPVAPSPEPEVEAPKRRKKA